MESEAIAMRAEYDFSKAQKNPYAKILKKQITINLDSNTVDYFKAQSEQVLDNAGALHIKLDGADAVRMKWDVDAIS